MPMKKRTLRDAVKSIGQKASDIFFDTSNNFRNMHKKKKFKRGKHAAPISPKHP